MTEETIKKVFEFIQKTYNKDNIFYFKLVSLKNIKSYFKETDEEFATFYVDKIIDYLESEEDYEDSK